ncbi:hypothetical protein F4824DRAFT_498491 [Ustulina deusta]|nr:hypothetical protein F4823DRAFT_564263 [Ustulina deusta]KAI3339222.1 hypothetical protein F4824DRAFT_498491 [Ustulina deusta]
MGLSGLLLPLHNNGSCSSSKTESKVREIGSGQHHGQPADVEVPEDLDLRAEARVAAAFDKRQYGVVIDSDIVTIIYLLALDD